MDPDADPSRGEITTTCPEASDRGLIILQAEEDCSHRPDERQCKCYLYEGRVSDSKELGARRLRGIDGQCFPRWIGLSNDAVCSPARTLLATRYLPVSTISMFLPSGSLRIMNFEPATGASFVTIGRALIG
jgi:hypothetical protein